MQIFNLFDVDFTKLTKTIRIVIPAKTAKIGPPVGPILGQTKVKVKDFCSLYNETTDSFKPGLPLKVIIFVYKNETFHFIIKPPTTFFLIKNLLNESNRQKSEITLLDIYKIMLIKKNEFKYLPENLIFKNILIILKSININIKL